MTFKELLLKKNISGYALSKNTGIPYTTINDLINGKTIVQNISLRHALELSSYLNIDIKKLAELDTVEFIEFRYFRNTVLQTLKEMGEIQFVNFVIKGKDIDYYYKNKGYEYAYYLLALIDYICKKNNIPIYQNRYNKIRKNKLTKPFFVGSNLFSFDSIEQAENELGVKTIPEFSKYNIIEVSTSDVA